MAATLLYLSISFKGVKVSGESTARGYAGWIEIESFSWDMEAKQVPDVNKASKARTVPEPGMLEMSKFVDQSTMTLCGKMRDREKFDQAVLVFAHRADEANDNRKVMEITLKDGYVEGVKIDLGGSGKALQVKETLSLSFTSLEMKHFPQSADLSTRAAGAMSYQTSQPCAV